MYFCFLIDAGMDALLPKPVSRQRLEELLETWLADREEMQSPELPIQINRRNSQGGDEKLIVSRV